MAFTVLLICLFIGGQIGVLWAGSGRRRLRRAWAAIHAGQLGKGRRLLQPFLLSPAPGLREPARIALLAAARVSGDRPAMKALLQSLRPNLLSPENQRRLKEEQVRALIALGDTAEAVRCAECLAKGNGDDDGDDDPMGGGGGAREDGVQELLAYALLCDGRQGAAYEALRDLSQRSSLDPERRAWASYQLGLLCRQLRREAEAEQHLQEAARLGARGEVGAHARAALQRGALPERL